MAENSTRGAILITGSSTGIGEACALHLDRLGFRVYAGVRRDPDGEALRQKSSDRLMPVHIDVTDLASIAAARAAIEQKGIALTGLVNNAGIVAAGPLEILPLVEFRRQLEVNVVGQLAVTQAFIPLLRRARGRIVMMGSISGRFAAPFVGAYAISKFALEAMTDALRVELIPWGIEVSIIEPGSIATPIWEKSRKRSGEVMRTIPAETREPYHRQIECARKAAKDAADSGIPASEVAKVVEHALVAPRPKTRYLVGKGARRLARISTFVPDRLRDRLLIRKLGLPIEP